MPNSAFNSTQKIAFISVSDKAGLEQLAQALFVDYGYQLLATGGTRQALEKAGIPVIDSSDVTGFSELVGGRVKSLHPHIFAGILADRDDESHMKDLPFAIDTVIVNLYPFDQKDASFHPEDEDDTEMRMLIDIGGSSLIRAAAKNYPFVNVLCNPKQYDAFLESMKANNGETTKAFRRQLASEAFQRSSQYDTAISNYFLGGAAPNQLEDTIILPLKKIEDLRYGENPHQAAAVYGLGTRKVDYECLHGKQLSYNNILDMQAAWNLVNEFNDIACVIIKHNNPCGVAISQISTADAYDTAFNADPLSAFGGIVAFNEAVDAEAANKMKDVFLEVIMAPAFQPEALEILQAKKNLRLVVRPTGQQPANKVEIKQLTEDLYLVQQATRPADQPEVIELNVVTEKKPTPEQLSDMTFAWKVVKHVKSNGIVLAKDGRTVGIGCGQTSRIGALEVALTHACEEAKDAVMASDGFLPAVDNIHAASLNRIGAIIQPGGSIKDTEVIELANQNGLAMVTTGIREFRH